MLWYVGDVRRCVQVPAVTTSVVLHYEGEVGDSEYSLQVNMTLRTSL